MGKANREELPTGRGHRGQSQGVLIALGRGKSGGRWQWEVAWRCLPCPYSTREEFSFRGMVGAKIQRDQISESPARENHQPWGTD